MQELVSISVAQPLEGGAKNGLLVGPQPPNLTPTPASKSVKRRTNTLAREIFAHVRFETEVVPRYCGNAPAYLTQIVIVTSANGNLVHFPAPY